MCGATTLAGRKDPTLLTAEKRNDDDVVKILEEAGLTVIHTAKMDKEGKVHGPRSITANQRAYIIQSMSRAHRDTVLYDMALVAIKADDGGASRAVAFSQVERFENDLPERQDANTPNLEKAACVEIANRMKWNIDRKWQTYRQFLPKDWDKSTVQAADRPPLARTGGRSSSGTATSKAASLAVAAISALPGAKGQMCSASAAPVDDGFYRLFTLVILAFCLGIALRTFLT
jgi:hypothetical protein